MEDLTPIEKIDTVLLIFKPLTGKLESGETQLLLWQKVHTLMDKRLFEEILFKLEKDGYLRSETNVHVIRDGVTHHADPKLYKLTFEGELFLLSGGYTKKAFNDDRNEKRIVRNEIWLNWGTWLAGTGATSLVLWEIAKWPFHHEGWHLPF